MSEINREAWLSAVASVEPANDPDAMTVGDLMEMFAWKRTAARFRIKQLTESGKAVQTSKRILDRSGRQQSVTAYRLVEQESHDGRKNHRVERRTRRA